MYIKLDFAWCYDFCPCRQKDNKHEENEHAKVSEPVSPPSEPARPGEPAKQDNQAQADGAPEKVLQIDDPKAVHIDGEGGVCVCVCVCVCACMHVCVRV